MLCVAQHYQEMESTIQSSSSTPAEACDSACPGVLQYESTFHDSIEGLSGAALVDAAIPVICANVEMETCMHGASACFEYRNYRGSMTPREHCSTPNAQCAMKCAGAFEYEDVFHSEIEGLSDEEVQVKGVEIVCRYRTVAACFRRTAACADFRNLKEHVNIDEMCAEASPTPVSSGSPGSSGTPDETVGEASSGWMAGVVVFV